MPDPEQMLSSWKEIASYLNRTARTCQRLEREMGLPVHRLDGSPKAHVFAYRAELDAWLSDMMHEREKKRKRRRLLYISASSGVVVVAAAILLLVLGGRGPARDAASVSNENSVAVLAHSPNPGPNAESIAEGIADTVINTLWRIPGLRVPCLNSSDALRKLDYAEIGRRLKVKNILRLGVQTSGNDLRVTAQLVNARDGQILWSETYDRPLSDIFEIQDQISRSMAEQMETPLIRAGEPRSGAAPTKDIEAYNLYQRGRYLISRPRPEAPGQALSLFDEALRRDPNFALAYVGIARAYMYMQVLFLKPATEVCPKAEAALKTALGLEPDLAEAHALMAWVQFLYHFDWDAADQSFRRALELKPGDALTRGMYAYSLVPKKRLAEARNEIELALATDPLIPTLYVYSMWIHLFSRQNERVLEVFSRLQQIEPNLGPPVFIAGLAYLNIGRLKESIEMFQKACRIPHRTGQPEAGLAAAYLRSGDRVAAEALYMELIKEWKKDRAASPVHVAWVTALLGDLNAASRWVEIAIEEHDPGVVSLLNSVEISAPEVAHDPRLLAILDRLKLPH